MPKCIEDIPYVGKLDTHTCKKVGNLALMNAAQATVPAKGLTYGTVMTSSFQRAKG